MRRIIYDVGANNGDNIPYYLLKCDLVVAVEANPALCLEINDRFIPEISAGRLVVENCVVSTDISSSTTSFFIHKQNHVLSQLGRPSRDQTCCFEEVLLPSKSILEIIKAYGDPFYVKVDLEGSDAEVLRTLFEARIFPPFISSEAHSIEVFAVLVAHGGYDVFNLVNGGSVSMIYANRVIQDYKTKGCVRYSFPHHSAGPFGSDVDGKWMTAENFMRRLTFEGFGWKDIHASNVVHASPLDTPSIPRYFVKVLKGKSMILLEKLVASISHCFLGR